MPESFADPYTKYCSLVIKEVGQRLGRELTPEERASISSTGSLMLLEALERWLMTIETVADLERQPSELAAR